AVEEPAAAQDLSLEGNVATNALCVHSLGATRYVIMDAMGRVIRSGTMGPGRAVVAVDDLVPGTYILRSTDADAVGLRFLVLRP
ncbi:MAG: hypothetical protein ABI432_18820, partial [Flavobacteriales bacterium]